MGLKRDPLRVLVTCPPMLGMIDEFRPSFAARSVELHCPAVTQVMAETELVELVPGFDGWIIGDDPASERVLAAGRKGRLRAAIKWGVGTDNVALHAAERLGIAVRNTPGLFGGDVADLAMCYLTALARDAFRIDRGVREGGWPKPRGISLRNRRVGLVGVGDVGGNLARRLHAAEMSVVAYDPRRPETPVPGEFEWAAWPARVDECDFLVFSCPLTPENHHMFDRRVLDRCKPGVRIVNVARGQLLDELALIEGLRSGRIHSAALDVMEREPLPPDSPLRQFPQCVFGTHNASNTDEAVRAASTFALNELFRLLRVE